MTSVGTLMGGLPMGTELESAFEGRHHHASSDVTAEAFRTLAMSAMRNGLDFNGMVKDAASAAFGAGALSLTDGDSVLATGRIGEPTPGTVLKNGLRALQNGLKVAADVVGVVRDGVTVMEDVMTDLGIPTDTSRRR